ncbi:MAG: SET domain-containing protein [bacterium]
MLTVNTYLDKSPIHGIGLFEAEFIPAGTITWKFAPGLDIVLEDDFIEKLSPFQRQIVDHFAYRDRAHGKFLLPADNDRFTNFSKNPNVGEAKAVNGTPANMIALRDI